MGQLTQYKPGTFSWTDLTTTDQEGAKAFYGALFGWEATDNPVGDGVTYSMMSIDGEYVAAIAPQPQQQRDAGVPPAWNSYITVESADDALEAAKGLGGTVHAPAFDVMDAGRMGVVQDPQGAFFLVWEPKARFGAGLVNAHGALSWNELASPVLEASAGFYRELFGWTIEPLENSEMPYMTIKNSAGEQNGGMRPVAPSEPPHWLVYFASADVDATTKKVKDLGGSVMLEAQNFPGGRFSIVTDPQGGAFGILKMAQA